MRVTTRLVIDIETGSVVAHEFYDYDGPVDRCCGGPSQQQKDAAASQSALDQQLAQQFKTGSAVTNPFYSNLVTQGLPYFGQQSQYSTSDIAQQLNKAKAGVSNRLAGYGSALPSGFAEAEKTGLDESAMQDFDQNQLGLLQQNLQAKMAGAAGLNPLGTASAATSGNNAIMQAPLQNNFWSNLVGGIVGAAGNIPFAFAKRGGYLKKDEPVMAHKGELILNKPQQKKYLKRKPKMGEVEHRMMPAYA